MNLDIAAGVRAVFLFLLVGVCVLLFSAWRAFREAKDLKFFLKRQQLLISAWRFLLISIFVGILAFILNTFGETAIYRFYQPSPSPTLSPTATLTPTAMVVSSATSTPPVQPTSEFTPVPVLPAAISAGIVNTVTPNPDATFSVLTFSRRIGGNLQPISPDFRFQNPIRTIYGTFSYDKMVRGSQWTAMWFQGGKLVCIETIPWNGAVGGFGYTECSLPEDEWLPGEYEVQIFVGSTWKVTSSFIVEGDPPTPTPSPSPTPTVTFTPTFTSVFTPTPSSTTTSTPSPSPSPLPTGTYTPTITRTPTRTLLPISTNTPTVTPTSIGIMNFSVR